MERERKLEVDDAFDLSRVGGEQLDRHTFVSAYFDTDDQRLLQVGITLRRRLENGVGRWRLKLPDPEGRMEIEEEGGPSGPPSAIAACLSGVLRQRGVRPIASLRTHRRGRSVDGVEVTLDEVEVLEGNAVVMRFSELEAELVDGSPDALERVVGTLEKLGARATDGRPKLRRVVSAPQVPSAKRSSNTLELLRAMIASQYLELTRNDPLIRHEASPKAVHDMRVGIRRLRSILRSAKPMLDEQWVDSLRGELDWVAQRLGAVRDLDVQTEHIRAETETLDDGDAVHAGALLAPLRSERFQARSALLACMEETRYYRLLKSVEAAAAAPATRRADIPVGVLAAHEFRRLRKHGHSPAKTTNDAGLHKARIQAKRARYAAELAEPATGKEASAFIEAATAVQDIGGQHQDAVVEITQLRRLARLTDNQEVAVVAGRLIERAKEQKRQSRTDFDHAWRKMHRIGKRAWST